MKLPTVRWREFQRLPLLEASDFTQLPIARRLERDCYFVSKTPKT